MRFRRIEKDAGGMANVGLPNQHMQGKEDDVTTSDSKTYIGSNSKRKQAMNKIKNTRVGDDIHYYINGVEGRGIVVKMANEYLEVFKENGQLGTIHINDTFFVKDILVNKQWDDMDDHERYDALVKIHAPSPRYITKTWFDMPEEIKALLRKEGSTYEKGESKSSETQDHARTGFAQNEQYSSKKPKGCDCGDPECKDPKCKKHTDSKKCNVCDGYITKVSTCPHCGKNPNYEPDWVDPETGTVDRNEHHFRYQREKKEKKTGKMQLGHPDYYDKVKNPHWTTPSKTGKLPTHPLDGGFAPNSAEEKHRKNRRILGAVTDDDFNKKHEEYHKRRSTNEAELNYKKEMKDYEDSKPKDPSAKEEPKKEESKKPAPKKEPKDDEPSGGFVLRSDGEIRETKKAYEIWLERRDKAGYVTKPAPTGTGGTASNLPSGKKEQTENEKDDDLQTRAGQSSDTRIATTVSDMYAADAKRGERKQPPQSGQTPEHYEPKDAPKDMYKSDVEHGHYGNVGGAPNVAISTDTKVDVTTGTGYEERPHISVEEAGKLPRSTFNESGSELTVSGSQDSKDEPKFSQPHSQEHPVRKAGLPQQHPNTYGVRYGMKGGVKKVWCPEHQMWEETRKDWHEEE